MFKALLVEVRRGLAEVCTRDGQSGDGGSLGAKDSWPQSDGLPGLLGEELKFFGGPAAFGADCESDLCFSCLFGGAKGGLERSRLFDLAQEDARGSGLGGEGGMQGGGIGDRRDGGAAGLLGGFEGDASPAICAFGGGEGEVLFRAAGEDGGDAIDAELSSLFDGPLEVIEFEDGEQEMEGKYGVGLELFVQGEVNAVEGDGGDLGTVQEAAGDQVVDLPWFGAQDAGEVGGLVAGEGGGLQVAIPGVGDEAAASHGDSLGGSMRREREAKGKARTEEREEKSWTEKLEQRGEDGRARTEDREQKTGERV